VNYGLSHRKRQLQCQELTSKDLDISQLINLPGWRDKFLAGIQEQESKSLEELYAPKTSESPIISASVPLSRDQSEDPQVQTLLTKFQKCRITVTTEASVLEEQEREVAHEVERERQVERPPKLKARTHQLNKDVRAFVRTGRIRNGRKAFTQAFKTLETTSAGSLLPGFNFSPYLLSTVDFASTVSIPKLHTLDDYLRPVNYVLSTTTPDGPLFVIISPFEANALMADIRESQLVRLHLYSPRVTKSMRSVDNLELYTISGARRPFEHSPDLVRDLNLFAGQLYLKNLACYQDLCAFLGLAPGIQGQRPPGLQVGCDGFLGPDAQKLVGIHSPFVTSPLEFLKVFVGIRRKGQDHTATHLGKVISAKTLREEVFQ
jgi:hypothetical protein